MKHQTGKAVENAVATGKMFWRWGTRNAYKHGRTAIQVFQDWGATEIFKTPIQPAPSAEYFAVKISGEWHYCYDNGISVYGAIASLISNQSISAQDAAAQMRLA
jgi:hypothetical protein